MGKISLQVSAATLWLLGAAPLQAQPQNLLPQGEGRDLVAVACTQCHALTPIIAGREGTAGWRRHVYNMVLRGAPLNATEAETVIRYLSANFGPGKQATASIALPNGAGKELVETRCSVCHDLERVAVIKRPKRDWPTIVANMVSRGAVATADESQAIAAYLVAHFGSD